MSTQQRISQTERDLQALELRKGGATLQEIAQALGYAHRSSAYRAIQRSLRTAVFESADEYRQIILLRYEQLFMSVWPKVLKGDGKAASTAISVLAAEARLLGIDSPAKLEITRGPAMLHEMAHKAARLYPELDVDEIIAEAERFLEAEEE